MIYSSHAHSSPETEGSEYAERENSHRSTLLVRLPRFVLRRMRALRDAAISASSLLVSASSSSSTCFCIALILLVHSASEASGLEGMFIVLRRAALDGRGISSIGRALVFGRLRLKVPGRCSVSDVDRSMIMLRVSRFLNSTSSHQKVGVVTKEHKE